MGPTTPFGFLLAGSGFGGPEPPLVPGDDALAFSFLGAGLFVEVELWAEVVVSAEAQVAKA